jgi:hypothetical protein
VPAESRRGVNHGGVRVRQATRGDGVLPGKALGKQFQSGRAWVDKRVPWRGAQSPSDSNLRGAGRRAQPRTGVSRVSNLLVVSRRGLPCCRGWMGSLLCGASLVSVSPLQGSATLMCTCATAVRLEGQHASMSRCRRERTRSLSDASAGPVSQSCLVSSKGCVLSGINYQITAFPDLFWAESEFQNKN